MGTGITGQVVQVMCRSIQIISLDGGQITQLQDLVSGFVYQFPSAATLLEPAKIPEAVNVELPSFAQLPIFALLLLLQNVQSVILDIEKLPPLRHLVQHVQLVNIKTNLLQVHLAKLVPAVNIKIKMDKPIVNNVRRDNLTISQVELNYHNAKIVWQENTEQLQVCQHV